jgi:hypothetical protein
VEAAKNLHGQGVDIFLIAGKAGSKSKAAKQSPNQGILCPNGEAAFPEELPQTQAFRLDGCFNRSGGVF